MTLRDRSLAIFRSVQSVAVYTVAYDQVEETTGEMTVKLLEARNDMLR